MLLSVQFLSVLLSCLYALVKYFPFHFSFLYGQSYLNNRNLFPVIKGPLLFLMLILHTKKILNNLLFCQMQFTEYLFC